MSSTQELLRQAEDLAPSNPKRAEDLYKQILDSTGVFGHYTSWLLVLIMQPASTSNGSIVNGDKEQSLRDQESALIKLAELYRDQK
jgi:26S proteasome regulatory subunit N6